MIIRSLLRVEAIGKCSTGMWRLAVLFGNSADMIVRSVETIIFPSGSDFLKLHLIRTWI